MKTAIKYILNANPFWVYLKAHYCPQCGQKMRVGYTGKIVNSKSPESENYDFSCGDIYCIGDVEFRIMNFQCKNCLRDISFEEVKNFEKIVSM